MQVFLIVKGKRKRKKGKKCHMVDHIAVTFLEASQIFWQQAHYYDMNRT